MNEDHMMVMRCHRHYQAPSASTAPANATAVVSFSLRKLSLVTLALLVSSQCLTFTVYQAGLREQQQQQRKQFVENASSSSSDVFHFITHWKVRDNYPHDTKNAKVRLSATESSIRSAGFLAPGTIVQVVPYPRNPKYLFVIQPIRGFALRNMFQALPELDANDTAATAQRISPYLFTGYRIETGPHRNGTARYLYAPWRLVVAQQLWNALQVCQVILTVVLWYVQVRMMRLPVVQSTRCSNFGRLSWRRIILVGSGWILLLTVVVLLPFSMYVTSPGAIVFAELSFMTCLLGLLDAPPHGLVWTIGSKDAVEQQQQQHHSSLKNVAYDEEEDKQERNRLLLGSPNKDYIDTSSSNYTLTVREPLTIVFEEEHLMGDPNDRAMETETELQPLPLKTVFLSTTTPACRLIREETLGFLCNLASSLYNYQSSDASWPHWRRIFRRMDRYFGWPYDKSFCDVFNDKLYTLGFTEDINVPLYVPGQQGSTVGVHLFWILWSILPFLYIAYYFCMFLLAPRSPGVKLQRALILFAMFHFLFMTDVVSYRYGRGYRSPHSDLFHWFERWSWRLAVLMPIYQNCTSGHWKHHGHERFPWLGQLLHYAAALWGLGFFLLQVVCQDLVHFLFFLTGTESTAALPKLLGITTFSGEENEEPRDNSFHPFSYHGGLVLMWAMYLFLLLGGFKHADLSIGHGTIQSDTVIGHGSRQIV